MRVPIVQVFIICLSVIPMSSFSAAVTEGYQIEEIIITAQKRETNIQDTPVAISAFGEERLERSGIQSVSDLSNQVPSLQFSNFGNVVFMALRGIGMENATAGGDPGVAYHIDGVYIGRPSATMANFWDVERMEVLRGPQGTLYGRNTTGGSVNMITKKPVDEYQLYGDITIGDYDWLRTRVTTNVPLNTNLLSRISLIKEDRDGYQDNKFPGGSDADDADSVGARAHLLWDINSDIEFLLTFNYHDVDSVGSSPVVTGPFPDVIAGGPRLAGLTNTNKAHETNKNTREDGSNTFNGATTTLRWDLGKVLFTSITAYHETEYESFLDGDTTAQFITDLRVRESSEQFSQELQLASNTEGRVEWIVGLYYFHENADRFSIIHDPVVFDAAALAAGLPFGTENGLPLGFLVGGDVTTDSIALFGQATYDIMDTLHLTLGLRYSLDEKESDDIRFSVVAEGMDLHASPEEDWREPTGKVGIAWDVGSDSLIYATLSRGYKSGGINQTSPQAAVYDPEFLNAFEIGVKNTFLDNRLQMNVAGYYTEIDDLQVVTFGPSGSLIENAAEATISGLEIEFVYLPDASTTLDGSISIMDSEYDKFATTDPLNISAGIQDLSGNAMNRAPENMVSLGAQFQWKLPDSTLILRGEYFYQSDIFFRPFNEKTAKADSYENVNLRLMFEVDSEKWNAEVFVHNLTDEDQVANILRTIPAYAGLPYSTFKPPRQFGFRVGYRWK